MDDITKRILTNTGGSVSRGVWTAVITNIIVSTTGHLYANILMKSPSFAAFVWVFARLYVNLPKPTAAHIRSGTALLFIIVR